MTRYVALLRGINVGGKNIIKMADLKSCFEKLGFAQVATYIQSGNVLFSAKGGKAAALTKKISAGLSKAFNYQASVLLVSAKDLRNIVRKAPRGFGFEPGRFRYDVIFLMEPLTAASALKDLPQKPGVDQIRAGPNALYASRLIAKAGQSRLSRVTSIPMYQNMTIRNWNTTTTLLKMLGTKPE